VLEGFRLPLSGEGVSEGIFDQDQRSQSLLPIGVDPMFEVFESVWSKDQFHS
jgi:hypothetical protein